MPPTEMPSWKVVYFVEAVGLDLVKIGFSTDLPTRLTDLRVACPCELHVLKTITGGLQEEMALHSYLQNFRVRGEWFRLRPLRQTITQLEHAPPRGIPPRARRAALTPDSCELLIGNPWRWLVRAAPKLGLEVRATDDQQWIDGDDFCSLCSDDEQRVKW